MDVYMRIACWQLSLECGLAAITKNVRLHRSPLPNQPIDQPTNQPIDQSTNQPTNPAHQISWSESLSDVNPEYVHQPDLK